jgi:membrane-associated phospholipid phosphatase
MKSHFFQKLLHPPQLRRSDIAMTLIPVVLWTAGVLARPWVITPHCANSPQACSGDALPGIDRIAMSADSTPADRYSYVTQNSAGVFAALAPAAWSGALIALGRTSPAAALGAIGTDLVVYVQTVSWNGALMELTRIGVQRPRPYVYSNPSVAKDPADYTSFYSGHTSFTAAAMTGLFLILLGRGAPIPLLVGVGAATQLLVFATGIFRVLAGRHFLTDVLAGAVAGTLVAVAIASRHRRHLA